MYGKAVGIYSEYVCMCACASQGMVTITRNGHHPRDCGYPKEFYNPTGWLLSQRIVIIQRDRDI